MKPLSLVRTNRIGADFSKLFPRTAVVKWKYRFKGDKHYINFILRRGPVKWTRKEGAITVDKIGMTVCKLFPATAGMGWRYRAKGDKDYFNFVISKGPAKWTREENAAADAFMKKIGKKALEKQGFYYDQKGRKHTK